MNTIDVHAFTGLNTVPTLILVDVQREYICRHRPLGLENVEATVANCKRLLTSARENKIPVAFVRWSQDGKVFNRHGEFSDWIEGLQPTQSDMVFERQWPSCYSSAEFARMMRDGGGENVIIAGFTGAVACLATILDSVQNRHRFVFVPDASASHRHNGKNESEVHKMASFFISIFAKLATTDQVLSDFSQTRAEPCFITEGQHAI